LAFQQFDIIHESIKTFYASKMFTALYRYSVNGFKTLFVLIGLFSCGDEEVSTWMD